MTEPQAVWRGNSVKVLKSEARTVIIRTPCNFIVRVRTSEVTVTTRKRKPRLDLRNF